MYIYIRIDIHRYAKMLGRTKSVPNHWSRCRRPLPRSGMNIKSFVCQQKNCNNRISCMCMCHLLPFFHNSMSSAWLLDPYEPEKLARRVWPRGAGIRHPLYYYIGPEEMFSQRDPSKPELQRDLFIFGHCIQCNVLGSWALKSQFTSLDVIGYVCAAFGLKTYLSFETWLSW